MTEGHINIPNKPHITETRNATHGDFARNARISQQLKHIFRMEAQAELPDAQIEALDMIALKISRILSGHANFEDHWLDIEGYAALGRKACQKS